MAGELERALLPYIEWLRLIIEASSALVVAGGFLVAFWQFVEGWRHPDPLNHTRVRLTFAKHLALALELQLASDILGTAIAPSWEHIGMLAVIAVVRTLLNYFLMIEIKNERKEVGAEES